MPSCSRKSCQQAGSLTALLLILQILHDLTILLYHHSQDTRFLGSHKIFSIHRMDLNSIVLLCVPGYTGGGGAGGGVCQNQNCQTPKSPSIDILGPAEKVPNHVMIVSQNKGTPINTPKYYIPYFSYPPPPRYPEFWETPKPYQPYISIYNPI